MRFLAGELAAGTGDRECEVQEKQAGYTKYWVSATGDSATGTLTVQYRLHSDDAWRDLDGDNAIDLTAPQDIEIDAPLEAVKFTSSNGTDSYTARVYQ